MSQRIAEQFARRKREAQGALLPYFTSGFPNQATTAELICLADAAGAAVVEIGEPYSDSIADGPVIQESFNHALGTGHKVADTFDMVRSLRARVSCGLVSMVSYSVVHRFGPERYYRLAREAGFDGIILPDVPAEESAGAFAAARSSDLDYIGLIAPTTSPQRIRLTLEHCSGFVYQVADTGTTGVRSTLSAQVASRVNQLREQATLPICVGFGISSAEHVRDVCRWADGAIVGSAIVRRIGAHLGGRDGKREALLADLGSFLRELVRGTSGSRTGATMENG